MKQNTSEAVVWSIGWLCSAAVVIAITYGVTVGVMSAEQEKTMQAAKCIESGGTWIYADCLPN